MTGCVPSSFILPKTIRKRGQRSWAHIVHTKYHEATSNADSLYFLCFPFFTQYYVNRYVPWCAPTKICCIFGITTSRQYEELNVVSGKRNNGVRLCVYVPMLFCECMKRLLWGRLICVHKLHPVTIQLHFHFLCALWSCCCAHFSNTTGKLMPQYARVHALTRRRVHTRRHIQPVTTLRPSMRHLFKQSIYTS